MRTGMRVAAGAALLVLGLSACAPGQTAITGGDADLVTLMLTPSEADAWLISPDDGPVDGESPDCTGAPYDWPDIATVAHAAQFLDRPNETVSVILKRLDGAAAVRVEALRGALEPCPPATGFEKKYGAMINLVGDDSFAYQTAGTDDLGDFEFSNMLISCGDLVLELSSISYVSQLDQAELERLAAPVVERMVDDQGCSS